MTSWARSRAPSRYWAFQWYEAAIYLAVALAIAALCVWWVRRAGQRSRQ